MRRMRTLWLSTAIGIWQWNPDPAKLYPVSYGDLSQGLSAEERKTLTGCSGRTSADQTTAKVETPSNACWFPRPSDHSLRFRDRDGGYGWERHGRGVSSSTTGERTSSLKPTDSQAISIQHDLIRIVKGIFGLLRLAASTGFENLPFPRFQRIRALSSNAVWSVLAARDGTVWFGTLGRVESLARRAESQFTARETDRKIPRRSFKTVADGSGLRRPDGVVYFEMRPLCSRQFASRWTSALHC